MIVRLLLVGLVAVLGLELPSGEDLASWSRPSCGRVAARRGERADLRAEACRAFSGPAVVVGDIASALAVDGQVPALFDPAFEIASEGLAADFAVDLALSRLAELIPADESATIVRTQEPASLPAVESVDGLSTSEGGPAPSADSRLADAIRLTREAAQAWANLLQPAESDATR